MKDSTNKKSWTLHIGIHRGTLMSRDIESPRQVSSLTKAREIAMRLFRDYARRGCHCWFCYAESPTGIKIDLIESQPYW